MKKIMFTLLFFGVLFFSVADGSAFPFDRDRPPGSGHGSGHPSGDMCFGDPAFLRDILGLTEKQIKLISEVNNRFRTEFVNLRVQLRPKKMQLRRLLLAGKIDFEKVRILLTEISTIEDVEIRLIRIRQMKEIEGILSRLQREKLREERSRMRN